MKEDKYSVLVGDLDDTIVVAENVKFSRQSDSFFGLTAFNAKVEFQKARIQVGDLPSLPQTPTPTAYRLGHRHVGLHGADISGRDRYTYAHRDADYHADRDRHARTDTRTERQYL